MPCKLSAIDKDILVYFNMIVGGESCLEFVATLGVKWPSLYSSKGRTEVILQNCRFSSLVFNQNVP